MKKKLLTIALLSLFGIVLAGCTTTPKDDGEKDDPTPVEPETVAVESVSLDHTAEEVVKGQTLQLAETVLPANATNKGVTWSSDDPDVASVSNAGLVTANEVGEANITVKTKDGNKTASCKITVVKVIESVAIDNKASFSDFEAGESRDLVIKITPADNANALVAAGALKVTSSDETVATVSGLMVTGVKEGKSTITVTLFGKEDHFELNVLAETPIVGEKMSVKAALDDAFAETDKDLIGKTGSSAEITDKVYELTGKLVAVAPNSDTGFNAILDDGTESVYLQINKPKEDQVPFAEGDFVTVTCKLTNYYGLYESVSKRAATGESASWTPLKDVVKVDPIADFTPHLVAADMSAEQYNAYYDLCKANGTKTTAPGYTSIKFVNINASYTAEKWMVSDKYFVEAIGSKKLDTEIPTATLTAYVLGANTGKGKSNIILVNQVKYEAPHIESVELNKTAIESLEVAHTETLVATPTPTVFVEKGEWKSSNEAVATVDQNGVVTGVAPGDAVISIEYTETVKASCTVHVVPEVVDDTHTLINADSLYGVGQSASYSVNYKDVRINGNVFTYQQMMKSNNGELQLRNKLSDSSNGTKSNLYNKTAFRKAIKKVTLTFNSNGYNNSNVCDLSFANNADFTSADVQHYSSVKDVLTYEYTPATTDCTFFKFEINSEYTRSVYVASINIEFVGD